MKQLGVIVAMARPRQESLVVSATRRYPKEDKPY
jgi:hypothetical protein